LQPITDDDSAPHLRVGEFAVVDTSDTDPQHGEVYMVRWSSGRALIQQVIAKRHRLENRAFIGYWTRCLNFEPYDASAVCISPRSTADRPREFDEIKRALVGRVIGFCPAGAGQ
jgi:hypothetical protein